VQLDYASHFTEVLFLVLFSIILSIYSVSTLLELGVHYAEFFTRFNLSICLLKYDVTFGLRSMILWHLGSVSLFILLIFTLFFSGQKTVVVRDSMGFLGYCILRPFNFTLRDSEYYPLAQILGLFVFLYFFLCLNVVLLQFAVYGKALQNIATVFNIRLAYALGKLEEGGRNLNQVAKQVKKVIPFEKLYAEHLIIASLFRNMSQVNIVVFRTFLFAMVRFFKHGKS